MLSPVIDILDDFLTSSIQQNQTAALALIKFDSIAGINQQYGYKTADQLLSLCQARLTQFSKTNKVLHRLTGNKFALILPQLNSEIIAELAATKLETILAPTYPVDNNELSLPVKIGISHTDNPALTATDLYLSAEKALKKARQGNGNTVIHACTTDTTSRRIKDLHNALCTAIEKQQFELHLQPKIDLKSGQCASFETLIRWQYNGQYIPPASFIPFTETCELIFPITKWTLHNALRQLKTLKSPFSTLTTSVNISAACFGDDNIVTEVRNALRIWDIPPSQLILEITETAAMANLAHTQTVCNILRNDVGVKISIDDFGTGFSGFELFKEVVVDELKIDRSFVSNIAHNPRGKDIIKCLVGLTNSIGIQTVAEGIEDHETLAILKELGVDYAQGYFISKPFHESNLHDWLRNYTSLL